MRNQAETRMIIGSEYQTENSVLSFVECHGLSVTRSKAAAGRQT
jgi:hypothetical protein